MNSLREKFKESAMGYINDITNDNYEGRYNGFIEIVLRYKAQGISRKDVIEVICEIGNTDINTGQDEILIEVSNRLEGFCTRGNEIYW
jgi:hypothetical protein